MSELIFCSDRLPEYKGFYLAYRDGLGVPDVVHFCPRVMHTGDEDGCLVDADEPWKYECDVEADNPYGDIDGVRPAWIGYKNGIHFEYEQDEIVAWQELPDFTEECCYNCLYSQYVPGPMECICRRKGGLWKTTDHCSYWKHNGDV